MLRVEAPDGELREFPLSDVDLVIGRDESADVRVDDKRVSRRHAAIRVFRGRPEVEDLGSSNGVLLNGRRLKGRAFFEPGDRLEVGAFVLSIVDSDSEEAAQPASSSPQEVGTALLDDPALLDFSDAPILEGLDDPVLHQCFQLVPGVQGLGRLSGNTLLVIDASVSRRHLELSWEAGELWVRDLDSANGSFINGEAITRARLRPGDELRAGDVRFRMLEAKSGAKLASKPGPEAFQSRVEAPERLDAPAQATKRASDAPKLPLATLKRAALGSALIFGFALLGVLLWFWRLESGDSRKAPSKAEHLALIAPRAPNAPKTPAKPAEAPSFSPWSPKDAAGWPLHLPPIDPDFDLLGFLTRSHETLSLALAAGDQAALEKGIAALRDKDPIHPDLTLYEGELNQLKQAQKAVKKAEKLAANKQYMEAYALLVEVSERAPESESAQKRALEIREAALGEALQKARIQAKSPKRYLEAHRSYEFVLSLKAQHRAALSELSALEAKMRAKHMPHLPYRPGDLSQTEADALQNMKEAIAKRHRRQPILTETARRFAFSTPKAAIAWAKRQRGRLSRSDRTRLLRLIASLEVIAKEATLTEKKLRREPDQALAHVLRIQALESKILPDGLHAFVTQDLAKRLAQVFAQEGSRQLKENGPELAAQRWQAALRLDSMNPVAQAGMEQLESLAQAAEAKLKDAQDKGTGGLCEGYKKITRMTSKDSAIYTRAREAAARFCGGAVLRLKARATRFDIGDLGFHPVHQAIEAFFLDDAPKLASVGAHGADLVDADIPKPPAFAMRLDGKHQIDRFLAFLGRKPDEEATLTRFFFAPAQLHLFGLRVGFALAHPFELVGDGGLDHLFQGGDEGRLLVGFERLKGLSERGFTERLPIDQLGGAGLEFGDEGLFFGAFGFGALFGELFDAVHFAANPGFGGAVARGLRAGECGLRGPKRRAEADQASKSKGKA